jgi:hypothetical protein
LGEAGRAYEDFMAALEIDPYNQTLINFLNQLLDQNPSIR